MPRASMASCTILSSSLTWMSFSGTPSTGWSVTMVAPLSTAAMAAPARMGSNGPYSRTMILGRFAM